MEESWIRAAATDPMEVRRARVTLVGETAQWAAGPFAARRSAPSVMRPSTMKTASTTRADAPSAQFLAMPSRFNAWGPAPAISPRIAAAQLNALNTLIAEKTGAGIDVAAQAAGIAIRSPGKKRQAAVSGMA